jgi:23S rRNA pseudouridine1911/1915/1917 synthase
VYTPAPAAEKLRGFGALSQAGGELRPGIVHRLDKDTSGLIIVAKNDAAHRKLAAQFAGRQVSKRYLALVHGWPRQESGTVSAAISRDRVRRTRMTTRSGGGREAVSHFKLRERVLSPYGRFALLEVKIETGRTHQIRVHLSSVGHPVVGDTLYGAPRALSPQSPPQRVQIRHSPAKPPRQTQRRGSKPSRVASLPALALPRNFLHAAEIEFAHPRSGKRLRFEAPLPAELEEFLAALRL